MPLRFLLVVLVWNFDLLPLPAELESRDALEGMSRRPRTNYVKAGKARW